MATLSPIRKYLIDNHLNTFGRPKSLVECIEFTLGQGIAI